MKHLIPCITAALLLTLGMAPEARATCSFLCEGSLIDSACHPILPVTGSDTAVWTDATRPPLVALACKVQCCAPGMCSDPMPESITAGDLQLKDVKGTDLMGTFQEERSPLCMDQQVFSVQSSLTRNEVYDVVHHGLILSRFQYDPASIMPPDMGSADMAADMDLEDMSAEEDMATEQDMTSSQDMDSAQDMGAALADMGDTTMPDMAQGSGGDMAAAQMDMSAGVDQGSGSSDDAGSQDNGEDEDGCQTARTGTPAGPASLGLLGLGLLVGVRRLKRRA